MLTYPFPDPEDSVAFSLGPVNIYWYGVMYLIAFVLAWWLARKRARESERGWRVEEVDDLLFYVAIGVIVGGRVGYMLFYDPARVIAEPLSIFYLRGGGMSFHGGLVGVLLTMWLYGRSRGYSFFKVADFVAPLIPIGIMTGRFGNFINGNLWGAESTLPWAMVFPDPLAGGVPRHPSQLYQALLEGLLLFVILFWFSKQPRPVMAVSGLFLLGYGVFRFLVEFVRVPDDHIGYLAFEWLTMGQVLSSPMIAAGAVLLALAYHRSKTKTA